MANTYSQIYIQVVFAVKWRYNLIDLTWEDELYRYITEIVKKNNQKLLIINGMPDHIHILLNLNTQCCLSDLVREIKKSSNNFINNKLESKFKFYWQEGFGAFSYSLKELNGVISYIKNQKEHHMKFSFKDEYKKLLEMFQIEYKDEYLFDWINKNDR